MGQCDSGDGFCDEGLSPHLGREWLSQRSAGFVGTDRLSVTYKTRVGMWGLCLASPYANKGVLPESHLSFGKGAARQEGVCRCTGAGGSPSLSAG